ncbi:similar to nucleosome assembly protein [Plenodomus lingam JN3]|uniref:Similar to nucleosome assembly protein n=1 Tax=Leptosphaeria maculans (strain JN3 / isolate v23.1.3 / race Av1-4-5-6-7-8) TaxID=985895 RepID=E5ABL1_LEPMJ|nr:similar to nucleosome assembly protein [Plenodomus lingam JN3]CBY01052.1 similar to nucleosome assembly protein [Plenodomus lingam JN3]
MSEPIRNKKMDSISAPTPQNTPANAAPISSRAQQPGVGTIKEEDMERTAAAGLARRPLKWLHRVAARLGPSPCAGLKGVQKDHSKLEAEFQEEVLQLEKKYFAKFTPLYQTRAKIINGLEEPSEEQVKIGEQVDEDDEDEDAPEAELNKDEGKDVKGIPEFWLSAMKNQISLAEMITDRDEAALKHLTDVRMEYLDRPGFRLIFEFEENEFFTNKTITKTYFYQEENGYGGDFIYDHAEGDKIDWKAGKDLTVRIESKKQRNKNTKQTRVVKKTVPTESFFNFFDPPKPPQDDEEGSVSSDIEERLELDYQLGEDIKEKLIPRAIDWFTGEALQYENIEDFDEGEFEDEDDEDEDELSDDRDEDEESDDENDGTKPKQEAAECKQS